MRRPERPAQKERGEARTAQGFAQGLVWLGLTTCLGLGCGGDAAVADEATDAGVDASEGAAESAAPGAVTEDARPGGTQGDDPDRIDPRADDPDAGVQQMDEPDDAAGSTAEDAGAPDAAPQTAPETEEAPLYAVGSRSAVPGDTGLEAESYLFLLDRLDESPGAAAAAIEIDSLGLHAAGPEGQGALFVAQHADRTLTRYEVLDSGELTPGAVLDLRAEASVGAISEYGSAFQFIAADKAYYVSRSALVIWNPETMAVLRVVDLSGDRESGGLGRGPYAANLSALPLLANDQLLVFVGFNGQGVGVAQESAVLAVNTQTDAVTVVSDERCGFAREGVLAGDGYVYLATEAYATAVHFSDASQAPAPCMVRFDPQALGYDPDFLVGPDDFAEGSEAADAPLFGSLLPGPGGTAFIKILDPELAESAPARANPRYMSVADPVFQWAQVSLGDAPVLTRLGLSATTGSTVPFVVNGRYFAPRYVFESSYQPGDPLYLAFLYVTETRFIELTLDGPVDTGLVVPGQVFSMARLR